MLTCKSLFGLGYRGERLIEPLLECYSVVESAAREGRASRDPVIVDADRDQPARPSNCGDALPGRR